MSLRPSAPNKLFALWERFDAFLARRAWFPTAEGLVWILLSLLIAVQGWMRGFNLVTFVATFLLAMWILNALATVRVGRRLRVLRFRRLLGSPVHAGVPTATFLEIHNTGHRAVAGLRVEDQGDNHLLTVSFPELSPGKRATAHTPMTPLKRGKYHWRPLQVSTAYPFGLFRRSITIQGDEGDNLVLPVLGKLDQLQFRRWLRSSQRIANTMTRERPRRTMAPADFYGIREYRSGDSLRLIHWRSTARHGSPMVRDFEEPPQQHLTIILEAWLPQPFDKLEALWRKARQENLNTVRTLYKALGAPTPQQKAAKEAQLAKKELPHRQPLDRLEIAVSLAATLCWTWTRRLGSNITLGVSDSSTTLPPLFESGPAIRSVMSIMERLALVDGTTAPQTQPLIDALRGRQLPRGMIVLISPHASVLHNTLSQSLGRPVQLLDISQSLVQKFFTTPSRALLS